MAYTRAARLSLQEKFSPSIGEQARQMTARIGTHKLSLCNRKCTQYAGSWARGQKAQAHDARAGGSSSYAGCVEVYFGLVRPAFIERG